MIPIMKFHEVDVQYDTRLAIPDLLKPCLCRVPYYVIPTTRSELFSVVHKSICKASPFAYFALFSIIYIYSTWLLSSLPPAHVPYSNGCVSVFVLHGATPLGICSSRGEKAEFSSSFSDFIASGKVRLREYARKIALQSARHSLTTAKGKVRWAKFLKELPTFVWWRL